MTLPFTSLREPESPAKPRSRRPRPIIPYPGGKWYARKLITPRFPLLTAELVSPFIGGGAIELHMAHKGCRIHGSDIFAPLVNLYRNLLEFPGELADEVARYHPITPETFRKALIDHEANQGSPMERAARWYVLVRSSYAGRIIEHTTGSFSPLKLRFTSRMIENIRSFRAPNLTVQRLQWRQALEQYPDTFAYLDPPLPWHSQTALSQPSGIRPPRPA